MKPEEINVAHHRIREEIISIRQYAYMLKRFAFAQLITNSANIALTEIEKLQSANGLKRKERENE